MLIYKLVGIAIAGAVLSLLIKSYKPELAIAVPILTAVLIIGMCVPYLEAVIAMFEDIASRAGIDSSHLKIVLKITGVAYLCQFGADICRDSGEGAIAGKIELGGKVIIMTLSMPIVYSLLSLVNTIINF